MDCLVVHTPEGSKLHHELDGRLVRIGRSCRNDLVLDDLHLSRDHAEIERHDDGWYIRDRGAKSGTFVNGAQIKAPTRLRPGDRIAVGGSTILFDPSLSTPVEISDHNLPTESTMTVIPGEDLQTPALPSGAVSSGALPTPLPVPSGEDLGPLPASAVKIILEADRELVFHRPLPEILDTIMDLVARVVTYERGLIMLQEDGKLRPQLVRAPAADTEDSIRISRTIANRVLERRQSVLTSDARRDFAGEDSVELLDLRSVMCVPLWNQRKVIGLLYLDHPQAPGQFTEEDLLVVTHLATVAAVKIEHQRLFEREVAARFMEDDLQRAAEIQRRLLPKEAPRIDGYLLHADSLPCHAVGGDAYDFLAMEGGRFGIGLSDVAGKGAAAALLMCAFQASMRALATLDLSPEETLTRLNRSLYPQFPSNRYVTFFFGVLDPVRHTLSYVNAGHEPAFIHRRGGAIADLPATGTPVGFFEECPYGVKTVALEPGEVFVCYSDGATDERDPAGGFYGRERLVEVVRAASEDTPEVLVRRIQDAIEAHLAGAHQQDDLTLVILKRSA